MERTLILIKPSAVQRSLIGRIIDRFERAGLRVVALKMLQVNEELARKHYAVHEGKPFYPGLIANITAGPIVAMVLEGEQAIKRARALIGATDPAKAEPGTIRAEFALDVRRNAVHGSDSPESAAYEIGLFFRDEEIFPAERILSAVV
jgi:nucleoside-diphosphate kinase